MTRPSRNQIDLLRHGLKSYRFRNPGEGRSYLSWEEVARDIADATGFPATPAALKEGGDEPCKKMKKFAERLRQFVEGIRTNTYGPSVLLAPALEAVRDFLMDENEITREAWDAEPGQNEMVIVLRLCRDPNDEGQSGPRYRIDPIPPILLGDHTGPREGRTHLCPRCRGSLDKQE